MTLTDYKIVAVVFGFTLGFTLLTSVKAGHQTADIWARKHRVTTYLILVWLEIIDCTILGHICWFFINGVLPPGLVTPVIDHLCSYLYCHRFPVFFLLRKLVDLCALGSCKLMDACSILLVAAGMSSHFEKMATKFWLTID
jgi:hypothetical protein